MDLGTELRNARERAGISLPDVAARTRIPLKTLQAIERNDFASVPPGIFVRAFIRTYAREVGLDPATAVSEFRAMTEPVEEAAGEPVRQAVDEDIQPRTSSPDLSESRPGWGYALIVAALLIGIISMNRYSAPDESVATVADTSPNAAATPESVATTGNGVQIEMRAQGPCWVRAVVDGQVAFARLMGPGETETITAQREVTLRVGDPSALSYSINGRPGQPLGVANVPVTVRVAADGRISTAS